MYHSIIIEESLENPKVLENYKILKTKFSSKKSWHLHIVEIPEPVESAIEEIQEAMVKDKPFYFHIYNKGKTLIIVFKDKVFNLDLADTSTWKDALEYGVFKLSIPIDELDFYPTKISEEEEWFKR